MEEQVRPYYPIGIQTFSDIIREDYLYVDKTDFVYKMTHEDSKYILLTRPRRFGKSLLVTTLKAYFEGKKDLFKGLKIDKLEKDWIEYPVLHFDFCSPIPYLANQWESALDVKLLYKEEVYGQCKGEARPGQRLCGIIKRAYEKTGKKVVVLIDEYDSPFSATIQNKKLDLKIVTEIFTDFFQALNDSEPYIRFVFFTGILNLSKYTIFNGFRNLKDISFDREYAGVPGFTGEDLLTYFKIGIEEFAKEEKSSFDEMLEKIKAKYNGYHFCYPSPDIYNPWCLVNVLSHNELENYWFDTGSPMLLFDTLSKLGVLPHNVTQRYASENEIAAPILSMTNFLPLFYQTGYLTIKGYDEEKGYLLDFPNREVSAMLMFYLLPKFVAKEDVYWVERRVSTFSRAIKEGRIEDALGELKNFLPTILKPDNLDYEEYYKSVLFVIFYYIGYSNLDVEVHTTNGLIDIACLSNGCLYLFALKFNSSALEAIEQINTKNYSERFALCGLPIVKVGINFSLEARTITDWCIEK